LRASKTKGEGRRGKRRKRRDWDQGETLKRVGLKAREELAKGNLGFIAEKRERGIQ